MKKIQTKYKSKTELYACRIDALEYKDINIWGYRDGMVAS